MNNLTDEKQDKIQEAYDKILNEKANFKYMGKMQDAMADFLEELEDRIPGPSKLSGFENKKGEILIKDFDNIDDAWENLWDKIVKLVKKL